MKKEINKSSTRIIRKVKPKKLVRGLDTLFGTDLSKAIEKIQTSHSKNEIQQIKIDDILPNPHQPRKHFSQEKLEELSDSITKNGLFTPIILRKSKLDYYYLVAGERRLRSAKMAGLTHISSIILNISDDKMQEISLLENIQRENLSIVEEAMALKRYQLKHKLSQEELAKRFAKSRSYVANVLRLTNLQPEIQQVLIDQKLTFGHIKPLMGLKDKDQMLKIINKAVEKNLNVRQVEDIVKGYSLKKYHSGPNKILNDSQVKYHLNKLRKKLLTKIKINKKNHLLIKFKDKEDFERIIFLLLK
ncbi:ParB/RepB/Spo0J family partition protein [Mycoplasma sp. SG1]|uniref:ParB/RepB/Spo0J family partition protein n=1 Tax=Mycoplasma sp. SG1 TaxID=2810348 RepID=UPI00202543F6|nr:ParB/RepB/Spo0J family partition protein [Mycoplasma sp. SG1]URM52855.1 ParB/RepB/Spo0J family partition protein [Mycoplasma sp. SG1]